MLNNVFIKFLDQPHAYVLYAFLTFLVTAVLLKIDFKFFSIKSSEISSFLVKHPQEVRHNFEIVPQLPKAKAKSRPKERTYVPLEQRTEKLASCPAFFNNFNS